MEIRPIKPEEKIIKDKIQSIAFLFKRDFSLPDPLETAEDYQTARAAFDDDGKMCSCMELIPFQVQFDGQLVKMGGIGGVASLPEEREKKYIRKIFEAVMKEMYEAGYVFSFLYPFSHVYYRKFGYELNMTENVHRIPVAACKNFKQTGSLVLHTSEMNPTDIFKVYEAYIKDKNLAVNRTEKLWKKFLEKDPYKDNVYLYIWYSRLGEARGYLQFKSEKCTEYSNHLRVLELVWLDTEAFKGIMSFIGGLTAQMETVIWRVPSYANLLPFFPEPYEMKREGLVHGMNRIVNVQKALEAMVLPEGSGEVTLGIDDDFFPVNSGNYLLSWEKGTSSVIRTDKEPDLFCSIQALSQLITGFASVEELKFADRIGVHGNESVLDRVFRKKKLFINNYF